MRVLVAAWWLEETTINGSDRRPTRVWSEVAENESRPQTTLAFFLENHTHAWNILVHM